MPAAIDVAAAAAEPLKAQSDGQLAENHPLPDVIAADNHTAGKTALAGTDSAGRAKSGRTILRWAQFKPGGAV